MNKIKSLKETGKKAFRKQLVDAGGTYTAREVSLLLDISSIKIEEQKNINLLAVQVGDDTLYPCWQFDGNVVVENFTEIMVMLNTSSPVDIVQFFLTKDEDLGCISPIVALKMGIPEQVALVKILAKQFHQHCAR